MTDEKPEISEFGSVDPAPASVDGNVKLLRETLCDEDGREAVRRLISEGQNIGMVDGTLDVKRIEFIGV